MLDSLASGLREVRRKPLVGEHIKLDAFLSAMLRSRISRRVLAEQHININNSRPGYIGIVDTALSLADAVDFAAGRCRQVCVETFGVSPEVVVTGDTALTVAYIPAHIDYMLYEVRMVYSVALGSCISCSCGKCVLKRALPAWGGMIIPAGKSLRGLAASIG